MDEAKRLDLQAAEHSAYGRYGVVPAMNRLFEPCNISNKNILSMTNPHMPSPVPAQFNHDLQPDLGGPLRSLVVSPNDYPDFAW